MSQNGTVAAAGLGRRGQDPVQGLTSPVHRGCPAGTDVLFATGPACFQAPGGGEVQVIETSRALGELGVRVRLFDPWHDRLVQTDILHLFGTLPANLELARAARKVGVPVVLSTVSWYDFRSAVRLAETWPARLKAMGGSLARRCCSALPTWRRCLLRACDRLLPNSRAEARQLVRLFGVAPDRIRIVPNGVHDRFGSGSAELFERRFGLRGFVLVPGRIEPRKNQLGLLRALRGSGLTVVILGDVVPGSEDYADRCRRAAGPDTHFLGRIDADDPLLPAAYAACDTVALPSLYETPGLVALEAAMAGRKVVITEVGCAREYFGPLAYYVNPRSARSIRRAVFRAIADRPDPALAARVRAHFRWAAVARTLGTVYGDLLG